MNNSQFEELKNIGKNQPVFAGDLQSSYSAKELTELGLVMRYDGKYVLTEKGKEKYNKIIAAEKLRDSGILYKKNASK